LYCGFSYSLKSGLLTLIFYTGKLIRFKRGSFSLGLNLGLFLSGFDKSDLLGFARFILSL